MNRSDYHLITQSLAQGITAAAAEANKLTYAQEVSILQPLIQQLAINDPTVDTQQLWAIYLDYRGHAGGKVNDPLEGVSDGTASRLG